MKALHKKAFIYFAESCRLHLYIKKRVPLMSKPVVTVARKEKLPETHEEETVRQKRQAVLDLSQDNCRPKPS